MVLIFKIFQLLFHETRKYPNPISPNTNNLKNRFLSEKWALLEIIFLQENNLNQVKSQKTDKFTKIYLFKK